MKTKASFQPQSSTVNSVSYPPSWNQFRGFFKQHRIVPENRQTALDTSEALRKEAGNGMRNMIRLKQLALTTERTYIAWLRGFYRYVRPKIPENLSGEDEKSFLTHPAVDRKVAVSTQNQAFNALLFFYRHVLGVEIGDLGNVVRSKRRIRLPIVLNHAEIELILGHLDEVWALIAKLGYGCGLRLNEALSLRVQDTDFERGLLLVRSGKGDKDRITVLPESIYAPLRHQLVKVNERFRSDRSHKVEGVSLPGALARKYPNAGTEWA